MKKMLIITSRSEKTVLWKEREQYIRSFCEAVEAKLADVEVRYTTYRDLQYSVRDGRLAIVDTLSGIDLKTLQMVHFKNWQYESGEAPVVAAYLAHNGVRYFNSEVKMPVSSSKLAQMFLFARNGLTVPDTFFTHKPGLKAIFESGTLPVGFTYPLIMKANDGSRGDNNHLVKDAEEALGILKASAADVEYVLQTFIPNDGDYRFLFIGLDTEPLVFHRQSEGSSHLNNTSKGGSGTFLTPGNVPAGYHTQARKAAELTGREISGVDILVDKDSSKAYVLEVNGTPALATGFGVEQKSAKFVTFLSGLLEAEAEK